jgi:hypothetical protein
MAFTRTGIYRILNNPIYKVQALLADPIRSEQRSRTRASWDHLPTCGGGPSLERTALRYLSLIQANL